MLDYTSGYIWFILATWDIVDPDVLAFNLNRIKLTFQCRGYLSDSILNGRTFIVIYLSSDNPVFIIDTDKDIATGCIGEAGHLIGDCLYLGWHIAFEVNIVAFSAFNQFLYL